MSLVLSELPYAKDALAAVLLDWRLLAPWIQCPPPPSVSAVPIKRAANPIDPNDAAAITPAALLNECRMKSLLSIILEPPVVTSSTSPGEGRSLNLRLIFSPHASYFFQVSVSLIGMYLFRLCLTTTRSGNTNRR